MKNIAKYLFAISAAAFTFAACEKEAEIKPGEPELDNCYGVYFPVQEASGDHIYNPTQDKVLEITVARTNTEGAITVPVTASFTDPDGPTDVFTASDIVFADGQAETTFTVNFDNAEEGVTYAGHFVIEDNQYASIYSKNSIGLDFTVMCVEMLDFKTEDGSEKAMLTFSDDVFWGEVHDDVYLKYYEVDGIRYCETTGGKLVSPADGSDGIGPWGTDVQLKFKWYTNQKMTIGEDEFDFIEVEPQYHGWFNSTRNSEVWFADYYNYYQANASTPYDGDAIKFFTDKGDSYPPCYYDGRGGFVFNLAYYMPTSGGYWYGFNLNAPVAIASGYTRVDYSLDLATDYSDGGETPVYVEAGVDIKTIKYEVFEGKFSGIQTSNKIEELLKDDKTMTEVALEYDDKSEVNYTTLLLSPEKSGDYTVIVLAYDEAGKPQASDGISIHHITAEDAAEKAVVASVFTEDTPARYQNLHKWDSFAYGISGENLTEVHVGIFTEATISKYGGSAVMNAVKSDAKEYGASEEDLAAINADGGFYDILKGLAPKTTYYIIVWATNGDLDSFAIDSYTTEKLPYVWNSLGKGLINDGFIPYLFDGKTDVTVPCDVYEEASTPGLYMVTGFQCAVVAHFFNITEEQMAPYEGGNWTNAEVVVDATDPNAVFIEEQDYGISVNSSYGFFQIKTEKSGTLKDGVITWPAEEMSIGLPGLGRWFPTNDEGTFSITLPSAVPAPAPAPFAAPARNGEVKDASLSSGLSFYNKEKVKYERDPQPVKVSAKVVYTRKAKEFGRNATISVETPSLVK